MVWLTDNVVIAASGPSLRRSDLDAVRGRAALITINETWRLAPWSDALYACDARWWRKRGPAPHEYLGRRFIGKGEHPECEPGGDVPDELGGRNSGFQAISLAVRHGARRVILTGFDMQATGGRRHHHADHAGLNNPTAALLAAFAAYMDAAVWPVPVVNATRETALRSYPRMTMEAALNDGR